MPNFQLPKGQFTIIAAKFFKFDLDGGGNLVEDTTAPCTVSLVNPAAAVLVEPVSSAAGNREFYVSVKPAQLVSVNNVQVQLSASVPADGNGVGFPTVTLAAPVFNFDVVVPVDHRTAQSVPPTPVQPMPHPPTT